MFATATTKALLLINLSVPGPGWWIETLLSNEVSFERFIN